MAKRSEAPTRGQALEELDDIGHEPTEGVEPGDDSTEATPRSGAEPPAEDPDAEDLEEEEGLEPAPAAPAPPAAWQPPEGGQPFRFRADHREVEVPGGLQWDHGIYVPTDAWDGVVQRHLADRDALQQYYGGQIENLQRQVIELNPEHHPIVLEAQATLGALRELFDRGPQAMAEWFDQFAVNRPLFEAENRAKALQQQLELRQQQLTQAEFQASAQRVYEELPGYLEQNIAALISQVPELKGLKGSEKKLVEQFWPYVRAIFNDADPNYPGQIVPRREVLEPMLRQEAERRGELKKLQDASKHNQRATGKATSPKTVTSRGRPVPAGQRKTYQPGAEGYRQAKDDFLDFDPLADED